MEKYRKNKRKSVCIYIEQNSWRFFIKQYKNTSLILHVNYKNTAVFSSSDYAFLGF